MAVEAGAGNDGGVPGTPRHVETPLVGGGQLALHLRSVGIPAQDSVVFAAREQQVGILNSKRKRYKLTTSS